MASLALSLVLSACGRDPLEETEEMFLDCRAALFQAAEAALDGEPYGLPAGFQGTNMPLAPEGSGWSWREKGGDNVYYTQELCDGWWYYAMSF